MSRKSENKFVETGVSVMAKHWAFSSERFDEILEYKTGKKKYNEKIEEHPEEVWVEVLDDCRSSYFMLLSTFP